jgi:predicted nucleotidyltransferase
MMEAMPQLQAIAAAQPYPLVFASLSGAHLYGFPSPDSDFDLRGAHVVPVRDVLGLYGVRDTVEAGGQQAGLDMDIVTHDIGKYFETLLKKNGNLLEQVYSPLVVTTTLEHKELQSIAKTCVTRFFVYHYFGLAKTQWGLFEKENPRRVKPLLYVYRGLLTGLHLMQTGEVESNLAQLNEIYSLPYISDLIARKREGAEQSVLPEDDYAFHAGEYERLRDVLEKAFQNTHLPNDPPGKPALNDLLLRIRLHNWRENN